MSDDGDGSATDDDLTHTTEEDDVQMVDIGDKEVTERRATARGWVEATNDPESAIDALVARNATLERNREIELVKFRTAADVLQFTDHVRQAGWGNHDRDRWTRLGETLSETDLLEGPIDPSTVWTNEYLDTASDAIGNCAALIGR